MQKSASITRQRPVRNSDVSVQRAGQGHCAVQSTKREKDAMFFPVHNGHKVIYEFIYEVIYEHSHLYNAQQSNSAIINDKYSVY